MNVAFERVLFATNHHHDFRVHFQIDKAVDYDDARAFQFFRPRDVKFLVETRLEFHERGHLLSVARGFFQCRDYWRRTPRSVKRHFY